MEPFNDSVALWSSNLCGSVFDILKLKEEFKGVLIKAAAILSAVIAEDGANLGAMFFEEWQNPFIENMDSRDGDFGVVEIAPSVP